MASSSWVTTVARALESLISEFVRFIFRAFTNMICSIFGSSISYVSSDGTDGAASPQILADTIIPSDKEVVIMSGHKCQGDCGFVRPNSVAYRKYLQTT